MLNLLRKELRLAVHPTSWLFLGLSLMLLIPSYPYYVAFFYTGLGIFFTCLSARENQDISYMLLLPLPKHDVVRARFVSSVLMELLQVATAAFTLVLHHFLIQTSNPVGMDANIALLGLALVELGLFNLVFFPLYYKNPQKVGVPFLIAGLQCFSTFSLQKQRRMSFRLFGTCSTRQTLHIFLIKLQCWSLAFCFLRSRPLQRTAYRKSALKRRTADAV